MSARATTGGRSVRDAMPLFLMLYLGHVLGDFALQPGRLVLAKRNGPGGMLVHTAIVTAATALVLAADLGSAWPAVLLAGLAHLGVEELTVRARETPRASGLSVFLLDQGLHAVSLALIAMTASPARAVIGWVPVSIETLVAVCGIVTVALFGSILVFEIDRDRAAHSGESPQPILGLDVPRVYGMAERAAALGGALCLPSPLLGALVFLPRVGLASFGPRDRRASHRTTALAGLGLCALVWVLITVSS